MKFSATWHYVCRAAIAAAVLIALSATVQTAAAQGGTDFSKVNIVATKLADNFYVLTGEGGADSPAFAALGNDASGGRIAVLTGPDGVFMVDAKYAPMTPKIVAAIKQVAGDEQIRYMVNTHVHPDHTGGNENFGKMGVTIIAREELRSRLAHPPAGANGNPGRPAPDAALPTLIYEGHMTLHFDGEDIQLTAIPHAHTDGDTMVYFPREDVLMTGDVFRTAGYPNMDLANGGGLKGTLDGLALIISTGDPQTKIAPGHGPIATKAEVAAYRDMIVAVRDKVVQMIAQGKTQQEVVAAHPTADYDAKVPGGAGSADRFVTQVYQELKAGK